MSIRVASAMIRNFTPDEFPPAGSVIVPQYAGVRTTDLDRDREAISAIGQFETLDGGLLMTFEYLRSETTFSTEEFALLGASMMAFQRLIRGQERRLLSTRTVCSKAAFLTDNVGNAYATPFGLGGIPVDSLRFLRDTKSVTEDFSFDIDMNFSDRFRGNVEMQHVSSDLQRDSVFGALSTWADIALDLSNETPNVQFLAPEGAAADYFSSGFSTYYWFGLDSREQNDGDLFSLRGDFEYDVSDEGFFRTARFGARWAARDRTTRNTNFSTWGNLSAPWAGRAGCAPLGEGPGCFSEGPGPFGNGFVPGRFYTGLPGRNLPLPAVLSPMIFPTIRNYARLSQMVSSAVKPTRQFPTVKPISMAAMTSCRIISTATIDGQWDEITTFGQSPERFNLGVNGRSFTNPVTGEVVACDPFCPPEISDVTEITSAAYARLDYGLDFDNGWSLGGNIGLRYVDTNIKTTSLIGFERPEARFDNLGSGGNGDGIVQPSEITAVCAQPGQPSAQRLFCGLQGDRLAQYAALITG